jgi:hypothetical protein
MVFHANALDRTSHACEAPEEKLPHSLKLVNEEWFTRGTAERVVFRTWAYTLPEGVGLTSPQPIGMCGERVCELRVNELVVF